jgi:hypothetical protein
MSRAHAVTPLLDSEVRFRKANVALAPAPRAKRGSVGQPNSRYVERAMSLRPRLDMAKVRRVANDPARLAEIIGRRTSQPYEVIIAMLTRQAPGLGGLREERPRPSRSSIAAAGSPVALRVVRTDEGDEIEVTDLRPA